MKQRSIYKSISDVRAVRKQFVPDGQSEPITYHVLQLDAVIGGNRETVEIKISADKFLLLNAVTSGEYLDEDQMPEIEAN